MSKSTSSLWSRLLFVLVAVAGTGVLLLPWWRNHGLLRDFYDYGNVMAGAGRIALGDRPYVDFLTPIQTLQFYQAVLAERLFGARYLSLTYANAFLIVASFLGFTALLVRPLGRWTALLVAAAVVAGSSGQHTMVWYNALGVAWVALVIWLTARTPATRWGRILTWILVFGVLWLGGMTKLTYQVAALAFAVLFLLRAVVERELSPRTAAIVGAAWIAGASVVPVLTEMALTGPSFPQWKHNVLELATSRTDLLKRIATLEFYWRTPHYYYEPMYLPFVGAWGALLLGITGLFTAASLKANDPRGGASKKRIFFGLTMAGAAACGLVFLAAHYEIAYVAGAAWLVVASGVVVAFVPRVAGRAGRGARITLAIGAVTLGVTAWASAWAGARSLYGHGPLVRSEFVSADDLPPKFAYLHGLRIRTAEHAGLAALGDYLDTLVNSGIPPSAFYFVNATDWMVRVMPEARQPGMPLWLQYGTTFATSDAAEISSKFKQGSDVQVLISDYSWDWWPLDFEQTINGRYRRRLVGSSFYIYRLPQAVAAPLGDSLGFVAKVNSNLTLKKMSISGGPVELFTRPEGSFVGSTASHRIEFNFGLYRLSGEMVAELETGGVDAATDVAFRIRLLDGEGKGNLLWDGKLALTKKETTAAAPFAVSPGGNRVALEVDIPAGVRLKAGWHRLRTEHAGALGPEIPGPIYGDSRSWPAESWRTLALFAADSRLKAEVHAFGLGGGISRQAGAGLYTGAPGELWMRFNQDAGHVTGEYTLVDSPDARPESPNGARVFVVYYKSGRLEVMLSRELRPDTNAADRGRQTFEVWMPEGIGWIGLIVVPLEHLDDSSRQVRWENLRVR